MNVIKGLDRIGLIIAIISAIPLFILGSDYAKKNFREPNPAYIKWKESLNEKRSEFAKEFNHFTNQKKLEKLSEQIETYKSRFTKNGMPTFYIDWQRFSGRFDGLSTLSEDDIVELSSNRLLSEYPDEAKTIYVDLKISDSFFESSPSETKSKKIYGVLGGILFSIIGGSLVFVAFRFLTRSVKYISLWIIDGFKD